MFPALMRSTWLVGASLAVCAATGLIFVAWPGLDMGVARLFATDGGRFVGDATVGRNARHVFEIIPFMIVAGFTALYALRRLGGVQVWAPNGAGLIMMGLSLALGPGLLVNTLLKDHSHRPRPIQVREFGGSEDFRPFYRFDGACDRNCSFVSGEGATAFWTVAAATLITPPYRTVAISAALLFGTLTGLLRMAFGGHFLSDTVFAALLTWLIILACWRGVAVITGSTPGPYRD